jgi:hypothetical protein
MQNFVKSLTGKTITSVVGSVNLQRAKTFQGHAALLSPARLCTPLNRCMSNIACAITRRGEVSPLPHSQHWCDEYTNTQQAQLSVVTYDVTRIVER